MMRALLLSLLVLASSCLSVSANVLNRRQQCVASLHQCGGLFYTGAKNCCSGYVCTFKTSYYSQCVQSAVSSSPLKTTTKETTKTTSTSKITSEVKTTKTVITTTTTTAKTIPTTTTTAVRTTLAVTTTSVPVTTTTGPVSSPLPNRVVYGANGLASGWENWSWSTTFNFAYADSTPTLPSGMTTAIQAQTTGWAGISFKSTPFTGYKTLVFSVAGNSNFRFHVSDTTTDASLDLGPLSSICKTPPTMSSYVVCYADISKATDGFNRFSLNSGTSDPQTIYITDMYFTQKTATELTDTRSFTVGAAFGSNTLMLLGTGDASKVTVSQGGNNVVVSSSLAVSTPIPRVYFTLSSSWKPGNYVVTHANGTISITIPTALSADISSAPTKKINPYIYGVNFPTNTEYLKTSGITVGRWGGNAMTTYNPENHWISAAADWFFESRTSEGIPAFMDMVTAGGAKSLISVPALSWVSKNQSCWSYSVAKYGPQQSVDQYNSDAGNGIALNGSRIINDPNDCHVPWTPESLYKWLSSWPKETRDRVAIMTIDNEMDIADGTHKDIHPEPMSYDLELNRLAEYGAAIRRALPEMKIAGPTSCCFWFWFHSAAGAADMAAHGNVPKIRYILRELYKRQPNLLDYLDLHFNPSDGGTGDGSAADNALRLRTTRSWWDPTYVSEGFQGDLSAWPETEPNRGKVMFIPRFKQMIAEEYPGIGLGATEWYCSEDLIGGLQIADTLGIFGREGMDFANKWAGVDFGSPGYAAYWLYRGGVNSSSAYPSNYLSIPIFFNPDIAGVYFASTGSKVAGVFVNKDPTNYQSYAVKGFPAGNYVFRHFGATVSSAAEIGSRLSGTIKLDGASTIVVPPYTAMFVMQQ